LTDKVAIIGTGQTKYEPRKANQHITEMVYEAVRKTLDPLGMTPKDIDNIVSCSQDFIDGRTISNRTIPEVEGEYLKPEAKVAADGAQAVLFGMMRILSGKYKTTLVLAHAKMSEGSQRVISNAMFDPLFQKAIGLDELNAAALGMKRYMHISGASEQQCAMAAAKNITNAAQNHIAFRGRQTTADQVMESPLLADPIREMMAVTPADGACALVLAHQDVAEKYTDKPVWITGAGCAMDAYYLGDRDLGECQSLTLAAKKAYRMTGITNPAKEIDLVELSEFYSYQELLYSEALGLTDKGNGAKHLQSRKSSINGSQPINLSGGVLGGNPICVAGLTRVIECAKQISQKAGNYQVPKAQTALAQGSTGPCGQLQCVIILSSRS